VAIVYPLEKQWQGTKGGVCLELGGGLDERLGGVVRALEQDQDF